MTIFNQSVLSISNSDLNGYWVEALQSKINQQAPDLIAWSQSKILALSDLEALTQHDKLELAAELIYNFLQQT